MIPANEWEPTDGVVLEPNADSAVRFTIGNRLVTAGPGSGKTELLAQRADFLLRTGACRYPRRILAISFKVDAAGTLKERVRLRTGPENAGRLDSYTFHAFANRIVRAFRALLPDTESLDADFELCPKDSQEVAGKVISFTHLARLAVHLVDNSELIRNSIRSTYSDVFLDEFQDTNAEQYSLMRRLFSDSSVRVIAVGDSKQTVMLFAGALPGVMRNFTGDFSADHLPMYLNHRSTYALRRMQNRMIQVMDPAAAVAMDSLPFQGIPPRTVRSQNASIEATALTRIVSAWLDSGVPPEEIAIIVRQTPDLVCSELVPALQKAGIPTRNEQETQDLTAEPAAILVMDLIAVISASGQTGSYERLFSHGTSSATSEEACLRKCHSLSRFISMQRFDLRQGTEARLDPGKWRKLVDRYIDLVGTETVSRLSADYQFGRRLQEVIDAAVDRFIQELGICGDPALAVHHLAGLDAVRIFTPHKCKGMEFKKVIVLGVEQELFWSEDEEQNYSEFFVAISRAKEEAVLTAATIREPPVGAPWNWRRLRNAREDFLSFAREPEFDVPNAPS